jgi:hypothetical protein
MWGKRKKRRTRLERQLALGELEDAMGRVQQQQQEEEEHEAESSPPYPGGMPPPSVPPARSGLRATDVPVDNSAGPEPAGPDPSGAAEPQPPPQQELPAQRKGEGSRHDSFG